MAPLVFKVKFQETLRRWVVPEEAVDAQAFALNLPQLESKIRDLFCLPATAPLSITYVDKDNDIVTLGDDQDMVDACFVQQLNPMRLEVKLLDEKPTLPRAGEQGNIANPSVIIESLLKSLLPGEINPDAARDSVRNVFQTFSPFVDPNLTDQIVNKVDEGIKEVLNKLKIDQCPYMKEKAGSSHSKVNPKEQTKEQDGIGKPTDEKCAPRDCKGHTQEKEQTQKQANEDSAVHYGVQCDRCGMFPIIGPRYNSKKVFNYDLCSGCFEEDANHNDYHKIERPAHLPHGHPDRPHFFPYPSHLKSSCRRGRSFQGHPPCRPPFARGPSGWRPDVTFCHQTNASPFSGSSEEHKKLDARFVKDVTIFDGTELAPHTKFTKIWRVSNNGTMVWQQGTQLLHIGGDSLCAEDAVNVQVPEGGLACGEDLEASIDLIAPEKAGRYVSHWRLASPSGQKFGHRLWVMIQVVPQGEQSPQMEESLKDKDDVSNKEVKEDIKASSEDGITAVPVQVAGLPDLLYFKDDDSSQDSTENSVFNIGKESAPAVEVIEGGLKLLDIAHETSQMNNEVASSGEQNSEAFEVKSEIDGFSVITKPTEKAEWFDVSVNDAVENEGPKIEGVDVDGTQKMHLQSLEAMGFPNQKLNLLLLKKNDQNLQMTVDDLLTASGWDGALKDLEDMGFTDQIKNIQLLVKNNGSIKLVVKELVKMEKRGN